eukprot:TRINITY_DN28722_c0_g1_i2.p1 TRINITY_DN28722_c0_g1~~TRINITY_DN28722_c0_g1_i2.p1  ORF type:complete len:428 (+),score=89.95 TRINITY_DN28722_c0_g1_i2:84-1286(+)
MDGAGGAGRLLAVGALGGAAAALVLQRCVQQGLEVRRAAERVSQKARPPGHAELFGAVQQDPRGSFQLHCVLAALIRAGVPEAVSEDGEGDTVEDVARSCQVDEAVLYRLLRLAASAGVFEEIPPEGAGWLDRCTGAVLRAPPRSAEAADAAAARAAAAAVASAALGQSAGSVLAELRGVGKRRFRHTCVSYALLGGEDGDPGLRAAMLVKGSPEFVEPWTRLDSVLKQGEDCSACAASGRPGAVDLFRGGLQRAPCGLAVAFSEYLLGLASPQTEALVAELPLPEEGTVADIAGGSGELLAAVLASRPGLRGVLFDLPDVARGAAQGPLAGLVETGRARIAEGDFFSPPLPLEGCDALLLRWVLHDWGDDDALRILRNLRATAGPAPTIILRVAARWSR